MPSLVTFEDGEDDFTRELWLAGARWVAALSDGRKVVSDDGRPGLDEPSAWLRLGRFVRDNSLRVVGLRLSFRGEPPVVLPPGQAGYFLRRGAGALLGGGMSATFGFLLAGYQISPDSPVTVGRYSAPDLALLGEEERDPADPDLVGVSLIKNY